MTTAEIGSDQRVIITDKVSLDFSGLFDFSEEATESPQNPFLEAEPNNIPAGAEKPVEGRIRGLEGQQATQLYLQSEKYREDHERSLEIYKEYQNNIKSCSLLQTEILKGVKAGEDVYTLFLKAAKAIALMTGNSLFYDQIERDLIAIYGKGLQERPPLQLELEQTEGRLQKLREALQKEEDGDSRERIERAIKAHEVQIAKYRGMIEGA